MLIHCKYVPAGIQQASRTVVGLGREMSTTIRATAPPRVPALQPLISVRLSAPVL